MRNYRFAIVQYDPARNSSSAPRSSELTTDLIANGWMVFSINLQKLLLDRVRAQGQEWVDRVIEMERKTADLARGAG